ncbi:MAG TPA: glycosyltransferase [Desulfuromonadales bacterium]|nr:glycosyltransferase [Desulfuromonadales bacterium]
MELASQNCNGISIVIPNYNGEQLLRDNLPSVFAAVEQWKGSSEVIIVDDCSADESCKLVREMFPSAKLLINPVNSGFSKTCNAGMAIAQFPILLCINTDVKVGANLLTTLASHFVDPELFAVTPRIFVEREGKNQGAVISAYRRGFIRGGFIRMDEELPVRENLYAIGACVAYSAQKYRALGGYCEMYSPFLFEDADISYRAWKRGWKSIYDPSATVWHYSNATLGKDKAKLRRNHVIYYRNRFLFHWINLTDPAFILRNFLIILFRLTVSFLWLNFTYYKAFWEAAHYWKDIQLLRRAERPYRKLGDAEILRRTSLQ